MFPNNNHHRHNQHQLHLENSNQLVKQPISLEIASLNNVNQITCPLPSPTSIKRNLTMDCNGLQLDQLHPIQSSSSPMEKTAKRARVLNVINGSDSESEDGRYSSSSIDMNDSMNSSYHSIFGQQQQREKSPMTPDDEKKSLINQFTINTMNSNNNLQTEYCNNNNMNVDANNNFISNADNDLLLECLKTIDLGYLNNVELSDPDSLTDWALLC